MTVDHESAHAAAGTADLGGRAAAVDPQHDHDLVLVVDFGAQYAQLIARRVREARVYSEIVPHTMPAEEILARRPKAIVLSGGPQSVYAPGAPQLDEGIFGSDVPVFGICYGFQAMAVALGGDVRRTGVSEFGRTRVEIVDPGTLLTGIETDHRVWMSHGDAVAAAPDGFTVLASTEATPVAAFESVERGYAGVQWHPEVLHTEHGQRVLEHFLVEIAQCRQTWTMVNVVEEQVARIREQVGSRQAICGLSGGVDSAVAAALVQRAIGDQLTCVFVDHGLLRKGEAEQVERDYVAATGVALRVVEASETFLGALDGIRDPEEKRKIIGREFIRAFEGAERDIVAAAGDSGEPVQFLVQGRCTQTWSSPGVARERPTSSRTTMSAVFPTTSSSSSSSRFGPSSRTRYAGSASSWAFPPRSSGATRSPGPAWRSGSSVR